VKKRQLLPTLETKCFFKVGQIYRFTGIFTLSDYPGQVFGSHVRVFFAYPYDHEKNPMGLREIIGKLDSSGFEGTTFMVLSRYQAITATTTTKRWEIQILIVDPKTSMPQTGWMSIDNFIAPQEFVQVKPKKNKIKKVSK
jgi:hypothetical protein